MAAGQIVSVLSSCQDPTQYNNTSDMLIFANVTGNGKPVIELQQDPCPTASWAAFDTTCKLDWLRKQVWENCDDFIEGGLSITQLSLAVTCGSLIVLSSITTVCIWWWKERKEL
jgi:hypothetical protein